MRYSAISHTLIYLNLLLYCSFSLFLIYKYIEKNESERMGKEDGRSKIKQGQIDILETLYKYRFGSRRLLADAIKVNEVTLHKKLLVLKKHKLIDVKYDGMARIQGKPAAYFLTPKGIRLLASLDGHERITEKDVKASYRDKNLLDSTVGHSLEVFALIMALRNRYPKLKPFLRRDMTHFSYFPNNPPDAFLSLSLGGDTKRFFLDYISNNMDRQQIFKRVSAYVAFFDKGGWRVTNTAQPNLLFVAQTPRIERTVRKVATGVINHLEPDDEPEVFTTTMKAIMHMDSEGLVWSELGDDELLGLNDI